MSGERSGCSVLVTHSSWLGMQIDIVTIFPDFFRGPLDFGIIRRAREAGLVKIDIHDLRAFTRDRHRTVDDRPFGGGEGMVLKPEPIFECIEQFKLVPREERFAAKQSVLLLSAQGRRFDQKLASEVAQLERLVLICGRYEGVDERVGTHLADREISIGDYVLSGGEMGAAVIIDAVTRLIPGAVGNEASTRQESFVAGSELSCSDLAGEGARPTPACPISSLSIRADSTCGSGGLLDYPHYTRPAEFRGVKVPEVLLNGNHDDIRRWRRRSALEKTLHNRPDLLDRARLSDEDLELMAEIEAMAGKR
jgi:tRNA (guanine37-N1)-methyltransferase